MESSKIKLSHLSGETLQGLFDNLPFAVSFAELDETPPRVAYLNPAFQKVFGYQIEDISSVQEWAEKAYPDAEYRNQVMTEWERDVAAAYASGGSVPIREVTIRAKDGTAITTLLNGSFVGSSLVVAFIDISLQVKAESELRDVRSELQKVAYELVENLPVGTYTMVLPPNGELGYFEFVSPRFVEITGLSRTMIQEDPLIAFSCIHPEDYDDWLALNKVAFESKKPFFGEARLCTHSETRWIQAESNPRCLPDGSTVWEGVIIDITKRKRVENSLLVAREKVERLERIKTDFLTRMSHEIRTPLTMIIGLTELLSSECQESSQKEKIEQLERSGEHLLGIVNDILDLSKIEAGQLITEELPFSVSQLVDHVRSFAATVNKDNVSFHIITEQVEHSVLYGDRRRIEQILGNLVNNAIKFTQHGKIEVRLMLTEIDGQSARLRCEVTDTGLGVPEDLMNSLFTPFLQGGDTLKHELDGTGLGLTISKELVTLMSGEIGVDSRYGEGSRFWFELPLLMRHDSQAAGDVISPPDQDFAPGQGSGGSPWLSGLNILVVDDSKTICQLVKAFLEREGAYVTLAENGLNALDVIQKSETRFDCVLADLQMPHMDGLTFAQSARQGLHLNHVPILAMTAGILAEQQVRARKAGMVDVISKPINPATMTQQILRAIHAHQKGSSTNGLKTTGIPEIDGIDRFHAHQTLDGNLDVFRALASVFVEEYEITVQQLRQLTSERSSDTDWQSAARLVHSLQGSSAQIGAVKVSAAAELLLDAIKQDRPKVKRLIDALEAELGLVLTGLKK